MLTPKENLVRELAQSATQGTWQRFGTDIDSVVSVEGEDDERMGVAEWVSPKDADYIVAVQPEGVLQILTRLEEALKENEKLKDRVTDLEESVREAIWGGESYFLPDSLMSLLREALPEPGLETHHKEEGDG